MKKLKHKAEKAASAATQKIKTDIKMALVEELSNNLSIEETNDGVAISGSGLGSEIVCNHGLRDVAFLMRGVR
ncbi:hypothetical protein [Sphingorhabdus sp. Alg231-15]|uniref:hypothetical protein n=1 Tax=Sphingorhabdus sp. Alg231-15 TaxID=1922222 RepID=UPI000D554D4B